MTRITLSWEDWRAVIAVLRASGLAYKRNHADQLERKLEQHGPDETTVTLSLTDDVYLRSHRTECTRRT
jgi:DNA repair photolyase